MLERGERGGQPGEADDRVEHDVDIGVCGELGEHRRVVGAEARAVGGDAELGGLRGEQLAVASRRERDHLELVTVAADDVERLRADRTGRTQDGDAAGHRRAAPSEEPRHHESPSARTR